ncbi:MAG: polyribonucleotide nucleotidyltransferase [Planctomycetota bacterium]|nr:MAG: polyribonucleotide nucleotidyltransferase [Planctomycetota bacterium]
MMEPTVVERQIGRHTLRIETGRLGRQAAGAALVQYGETVVFAATVTGPPREGTDFFPLTVDYREKAYAAGKIPGGFFKREARPTTKEILTMRMIDRPMRPLFPEGFYDEVLIQAMCLATDQEHDPDVLSSIASSTALCLSGLPFEGPVGTVRVGYINGDYVLFPKLSEMAGSTLELVLSGHKDGVNMIEVSASEVSEEVVAGAIEYGTQFIRQICDMQEELRRKSGKPVTWTAPAPDPSLRTKVRELAASRIREAKRITGKVERNAAMESVYESVLSALSPEDAENPPYERDAVKRMLDTVEGEVVRKMVLDEGIRADGRGPRDIRTITGEVGVLPRVHGSAIFQRGETQALVVATLGTGRDEQIIDGLTEEYSKKFMLHYNFPPLATGEVKRVGAVGRREIGHGALAEKSLEAVLPTVDKFPYTIRLVSEIFESNGSSSMASVCGGTLALMDAGVPIRHPVAGISIGMFSEGSKRKLVVDILGEEDHFGDMDFKVAGTQRGITGIQLDLKARGLTQETIVESLALAKEARIEILRKMLSTTLKAPRPDISRYAPRILTIKINPEKIGRVIGPGGSGIRGLEASTGATIEISQDGTVMIACLDADGAQRARDAIEAITEEVKVGKVYSGKVIGTKDFGAFIEIIPGQDGLCHISELSDEYVRNVNEVCKIGDAMKVKVIAVDEQGRVKLSRKAVLLEEKEKADDGRDR